MTDIPEDVREKMARAYSDLAYLHGWDGMDAEEQKITLGHFDAALAALRAAGYEVRRSDHIAALESLATGAADILPLVSEWFHASEAERAAEGIDWECRAHMGVLAVMYEAQALAPPAPSEKEQGE